MDLGNGHDVPTEFLPQLEGHQVHCADRIHLPYKVDSKVAYTKRGEILEEMCSLTWVYTIVFQSLLNDDTGCRDMWPLHWNTQPRVA